MLKMIIAAAAAAAIPLSSTHAASAWANGRHIEYMFPTTNGILIKLDGATINPTPGCTSNQVYLATSTGNYDAIVSTLMLAFSKRGTIDVYYDDASFSSCVTPVLGALALA